MERKPSLLLCILLDVVGSASYFLPFIGEWADLVWAPLSGYIFYKLFGGKTGKIGAVVSMVEEALPFTDIIPTFTIAYIYKSITERRSVPKS